MDFFFSAGSGQITIMTEKHEFSPQMGVKSKGNPKWDPLFQGNLGL